MRVTCIIFQSKRSLTVKLFRRLVSLVFHSSFFCWKYLKISLYLDINCYQFVSFLDELHYLDNRLKYLLVNLFCVFVLSSAFQPDLSRTCHEHVTSERTNVGVTDESHILDIWGNGSCTLAFATWFIFSWILQWHEYEDLNPRFESLQTEKAVPVKWYSQEVQ